MTKTYNHIVYSKGYMVTEDGIRINSDGIRDDGEPLTKDQERVFRLWKKSCDRFNDIARDTLNMKTEVTKLYGA